MVYSSDEHHLNVRERAVQHILRNPTQYEQFIGEEFQSIQEYAHEMINEGVWADNIVIRAVADTLEIEIHIKSSSLEAPTYTFRPSLARPSQTIILGHIPEWHYMTTASLNEPQIMRFGGCTKDGVRLLRTTKYDNLLSWLFYMIITHINLHNTIENNTNRDLKKILEC